MTLNLKLVRHQDGKWKALTSENDDIAPVPTTEKKRAPIDPEQLLKALDSLLSADGGIRSIDDVPRVVSLMIKFSRKLVSRCIYCNVLRATKPDILSEYLDKGGWDTINTWLQYAKSSPSHCVLLDMLKLCKYLPMTLNRLKENNTAKVIKSLTKHENSEVKELSNELVTKWMSIIKEKKALETSGDKKKKKEKPEKPTKVEKVEPVKEVKTSPKHVVESPKGPSRLKGLKRTSTDKETKSPEIYEDVKIDPEPLLPAPKKIRPDRPKTAKIYQKKFRATGLEEETPLPKNISKKTNTVDKNVVAAAKSAALKLNSNTADRITEKKIKPENLMAINENPNTKGIKLIPAKPRPTYILHESASFMDALISQPVVPVKRKKKASPKAQPPSPTITAPKLQFYKDTLEEKMSEDNKSEESEKKETENSETPSENASDNDNSTSNPDENASMEVSEVGGHTPPNHETNDNSTSLDASEYQDEVRPKVPFDPNNLRSILSHGKRRGRKKNVKWVEDTNIKEIFYFDMDETERVNVSRNQNFLDLKLVEMKRERETMEKAKRQAGDRVEEFRRWWIRPILVDAPPPLAVPGWQSQEKETELLRQQSTLQEIYFTKDMIPDSPHEPDLEIVAQKEPKVIPLEEENGISNLIDYSKTAIASLPIQPSLPDILKSLMKINDSQAPSQANQIPEQPMEVETNIEPVQQPLLNMDNVNQQTMPIPMSVPVPMPMPVPMSMPMPHPQPVPELPLGNPNGLLVPPPFSPPHNPGMDMPGDWQGSPPHMPANDYFPPGFPMNHHMQGHLPPVMNIRAPVGNGFRPNFRGGPGPGPRGMSGPRRIKKICRHFASGHCRYGINCCFLHPGVNGPPL